MILITATIGPMTSTCQLLGKNVSFGKSVSHSHRRTNRTWRANIQRKRYWLPSERRHIRLTLSARAIKAIDRRGIESAVAEIRRNGHKV
ncbi:MAG: large subunit ribosomal protein L28 [Minisyncoccia bacterium]|jgi:large subunit ribosomal protein L28